MGNSVTLAFIRCEKCVLSKQRTHSGYFCGQKGWQFIGRHQEIGWKKNKQEAKLEALSKESTLVISLHVINLLKRSKLTKAGHRLSLVPDNMRKKMGTLAFCQMAKTRSTLDPPKRHNGHHRGGDNSEGKFRTY